MEETRLDLTLKQLRAFVAVAESEHFTRAADKLGLSQSAISTLIRQLEKNLRLRLFDRHTRLSQLTQAGKEILLVAKRAIAEVDIVIDSSRELNSLKRGRVSIAAGTLQAALYLPRLIQEFGTHHPNISVSFYDVAEKVVSEMVHNGGVDLGLCTMPEGDTEVVGVRLMTDVFLVVMRPDNPLARKPDLCWRDLAGMPLIGPQPGNPIRDRFEAELAREGISLALHTQMREVALPLTIIGMVDGGLGVAVMTTAVSRLAASMGLITRTPIEPTITRDVSLISHRERSLSPAAKQFRDFLLSRSRFPSPTKAKRVGR
jgi:LysR family transcriptional regulator, carnitine catabolism transcriptional activator